VGDQPGTVLSTELAEPAKAAPATRPVPPTKPPAPEPQANARPAEKSHFWLIHRDQLVLAGLCVVMLALLTAYWIRFSNWGKQPIEIERLEARKYDFRIDVNSANWVEWTQLDGIGDALARRIVADREQNGPFRSIDDLRRIKGIGPKTIERLRPWLKVDADPSESQRAQSAGP